jgi:hypothetical protein
MWAWAWVIVGCRPSQGKRLFLGREEIREERTVVRESDMCEGSMQGIPNDIRVRVFEMYCNGGGVVGSRSKQKERRFWGRRHAQGK